jgi:hypothetical protein
MGLHKKGGKFMMFPLFIIKLLIAISALVFLGCAYCAVIYGRALAGGGKPHPRAGLKRHWKSLSRAGIWMLITAGLIELMVHSKFAGFELVSPRSNLNASPSPLFPVHIVCVVGFFVMVVLAIIFNGRSSPRAHTVFASTAIVFLGAFVVTGAAMLLNY